MDAEKLEAHFARPKLARLLLARPNLVISIMVGLLIYAAVSAIMPWTIPIRFLVAWNGGIGLYLVLTWRMMFGATVSSIGIRAKLQDEGSAMVLVLTVLTVIASFIAIIVVLADLKAVSGSVKVARLALAVTTIAASWAFIHSMFALHYAHLFYAATPDGPAAGLDFPGKEAPLYSDFLYFAFIIGTSGQTADVALSSRAMRLVGLGHSVLAFAFNTTLLALTINIAAGLMG